MECDVTSFHNVLQKNDTGWKKSNTHYVTNSYIQPLLLWTGAMLICRCLCVVILCLSLIFSFHEKYQTDPKQLNCVFLHLIFVFEIIKARKSKSSLKKKDFRLKWIASQTTVLKS